MDKRLSVYMKYGEKADTCSIFATVCPNHFEMCPIRVVYGRNNLNLVECSRILVEILRARVGRDFIIKTHLQLSRRGVKIYQGTAYRIVHTPIEISRRGFT